MHSLRPVIARISRLGISLAIICSAGFAPADEIYKCVKGGEISYGSNPGAGDCQRVDLQVPQPSPEELARLAEEQRQRTEQDRADEAQDLQERLVRAKEIEAQAAWEQARAADDQARLQREQQQNTSAWNRYYPYYPYGLGYGWGYGWQPRYWRRDSLGPLRPGVRIETPRGGFSGGFRSGLDGGMGRGGGGGRR
jgi:hypothetical protein